MVRHETAWRGEAYGNMVVANAARNAAAWETRSYIAMPMSMVACLEDLLKVPYMSAFPSINDTIEVGEWVDQPRGVPIGMRHYVPERDMETLAATPNASARAMFLVKWALCTQLRTSLAATNVYNCVEFASRPEGARTLSRFGPPARFGYEDLVPPNVDQGFTVGMANNAERDRNLVAWCSFLQSYSYRWDCFRPLCIEGPAQAGAGNPAAEVNWAAIERDWQTIIGSSGRSRPWVSGISMIAKRQKMQEENAGAAKKMRVV